MIAMIKNATKNIFALNIDGNLISDQEVLRKHVVDHFKNLFSTHMGNIMDIGLIRDRIPNPISQQANQMLEKVPIALEIKEVFNLNKEGAPVPDGFGAYFFQHYWEIIQDDVIEAMNVFYTILDFSKL